MTELKTIPELVELNLVGSLVTVQGLSVIRDLPNLQDLSVGGDDVTDAGFKHLHGHPSLQSLDVLGIQITDEGFLQLRELPRLTSVRFDSRKIQPKAVDALKPRACLVRWCGDSQRQPNRQVSRLDGCRDRRGIHREPQPANKKLICLSFSLL